jgi:membrane-associated HD superfamily phosphohydrolase
MERYPAELIAPDTVKDKEKEQQEAQKKAEFAHQEALEKLEEAKQERQEAMKAYQQALQEYHETMKEIKKAQWEKQLVWIQGDSLDSVKVFVKPGLSDVYIFSEDEFDDLPPLPEFIPYEHAKPGEYKYSYKYRYPKRGRVEVYKDGEDVEIILKELEENLEDIYKDIDVEFDVDFDYDFDYNFDTEKEFRKYEKGIRDRQKELERKIIMRPRPEQWEPFHNKPHMFFRDEPGAEQIIRQELLDDSLIRHGKEYIVELGADEMYINGEKQSRSVFKKYKKIYEGVTGEEMEGKVKLIF